MRILRDADPAAAAGGGGTPAPAADPVADPTAADTAAKGKTPREIALEKKLSIAEDKNNTLTSQLTVFVKAAEERDKKPAPLTPAGLLDEANKFLGWGMS